MGKTSHMTKLLIVDDHAGMRSMIRQLAGSAFEVRECATGEEAVQLAHSFAPDIVTMDIRLPGLGGLNAIQAIRLAHPATYVVIVSTYDQPDLRRTAAALGAMGYVVKDNLGELRSLLTQTANVGQPSADWTCCSSKERAD